MIQEEMCRTLEGLEYKVHTWELRCDGYSSVTAKQLEGFQAYADRQAAVYWSLARSFCKLWDTPAAQVLPCVMSAEEAQELKAAEEA